MEATIQIVRQLGGEIAGLGFAIELDFLKGRQKFPEYDVLQPPPLRRVTPGLDRDKEWLLKSRW